MLESDSGCLVHLDPIDSVSLSGQYTDAPQQLAQNLFQGSYYQGFAEPFAVPGSDATGQPPWILCLLHRTAPVPVPVVSC